MTRSQKKYLLVIYRLSRKSPYVKSADVARELKVSKPSTVTMVQSLADEGYIIKQPYSAISITEKGKTAAAELSEREKSIRKFLASLGINGEKAEADSLIMALTLSEESARKIAEYAK